MQNPTPTPTQPEQTVATPKKKSKKTLWIIIGVLILAGVGAAAWYFTQNGSFGGPVAIVNGEEITREKFNEQKNLIASQAGDPSLVPSDQELVDQMVNERLLLQDIEKRGIDVSDKIDAELQNVKSQFPSEDEYNDALAQNSIDEEQVRESVEYQLLFTEYVAKIQEEKGIAVTEAEIQSFYDESVAGQEEAPPLEEIRSQIESQIAQQKVQVVFEELIQQLREQADIQVLI